MTNTETLIREAIRDVADFPKPGILFKDITPIFQDAVLSAQIIAHLKSEIQTLKIDAIAGIESRGFFFGFPLAIALGVPFIPIRKQGKLPYKTVSHAYDLEYGSAVVEMHNDVVKPGMNVLIHDDLLATGGTAVAAAELILKQSGKLAGFSFIVELAFLNGRQKLNSYSQTIDALVKY
jgi:adenine phosphoribosyltransferase